MELHCILIFWYFDILLQHSLKLIVHQEENQFKLAFYLKKNSSENTLIKIHECVLLLLFCEICSPEL